MLSRLSLAASLGGVARLPGVWTRRGVWVAETVLTDAAARRAMEERKRIGDRQRQRQENEVRGKELLGPEDCM